MKLSLSSHLQTRCDFSFKAVYLSQHLPFSVFSGIRNCFLIILIHARQHTYRNGNKNSCYNLSVSLCVCCMCYIKLGKDLRFGRGLRDHLVQLSRARIKTVVFIYFTLTYHFSFRTNREEKEVLKLFCQDLLYTERQRWQFG